MDSSHSARSERSSEEPADLGPRDRYRAAVELAERVIEAPTDPELIRRFKSLGLRFSAPLPTVQRAQGGDTTDEASNDSDDVIADAWFALDELSNAWGWYRRAIVHLESLSAVDYERLGRCLHQAAWCRSLEEDADDEVISLYERAVAAKTKGDSAGRVDFRDVSTSLHQLGTTCLERDELERARGYFERAAATAERGDKAGRVHHAAIGISLEMIGHSFEHDWRLAEAKHWYQRAAEAKARGDEEGRVDFDAVGNTFHEIGNCAFASAEYAEARSWFERAAEAKGKGDRDGRIDRTNCAVSLYQVGVCLINESRLSDARAWLERALEEARKGDLDGDVDPVMVGDFEDALKSLEHL